MATILSRSVADAPIRVLTNRSPIEIITLEKTQVPIFANRIGQSCFAERYLTSIACYSLCISELMPGFWADSSVKSTIEKLVEYYRLKPLVLRDVGYHFSLHALLPALKGGSMSNSPSATHGIELLVEKCRDEFRRPENTNYYAQDDYKEAERKYVKFCLRA